MKLSNTDLAKIVDMFISYHMNAFRIRRHEIFDIELTPLEVEELENFRLWFGDQLDYEERYVRGFYLREAIIDSKDKLDALSKQAHESEDPKVQYAQAQQVMDQLSGANYLLELL